MKNLLFVLFGVSILFAGCSKEDNKKIGNDENQVYVTATLSQCTKTKVDIEVNDKGADVFWTKGDGITVFGINERETKARLGALTTEITGKAKSAKFEGTVTKASDGNYYVLYMGSGTTYGTGEVVTLNLTTQTGGTSSDEYSYLFPYTYMVGEEAGYLDENSNMVFEMEHICALLQFNLILTEEKEGVVLRSIDVSGSNIRDKKSLNAYTKSLSDISSAGNKLTLTYTTGPKLNTTATVVAMSSFPTEVGEVDVRVFLYDNGTEKYIDIPVSQATFEAGKRYTKTLEIDLSKAVVVAKKPDIIDYEAKTALITSYEELAWISSVTNIGNQNYSDGYNYDGFSGWVLTQGKDIDLQGSEEKQWIPIGTSSTIAFKGTYNGSSYKIDNIYINSSTGSYQGLFGYISSSQIKNVTLASGSISARSLTGGIAGYIINSQIITCVNKVNISGIDRSLGGISGYSNGSKLIACENYGDVSNDSSSGVIAAGIVGYAVGSNFIACINHGNIKTEGQVGGISGYLLTNTTIILSCINEGTITGSSDIGGVLGQLVQYDTKNTKELYFVNNPELFVAGSDSQGQGWNTKGPSSISGLNSDETIQSLNDAITEWNTNNPDYASPCKFAAGGDDNTIPKLVPIE